MLVDQDALFAEAYRLFPDEVHTYTDQEIEELVVLGVAAHPAGKIGVDRGNLRYAFVAGAQFALRTKSVNNP